MSGKCSRSNREELRRGGTGILGRIRLQGEVGLRVRGTGGPKGQALVHHKWRIFLYFPNSQGSNWEAGDAPHPHCSRQRPGRSTRFL